MHACLARACVVVLSTSMRAHITHCVAGNGACCHGWYARMAGRLSDDPPAIGVVLRIPGEGGREGGRLSQALHCTAAAARAPWV